MFYNSKLKFSAIFLIVSLTLLLFCSCGENSGTASSQTPSNNISYNELFSYEVKDDCIIINKYNGSGGNLVIPDSIDSKPVAFIAENAFSFAETLTSVTLPNGLLGIGDKAFFGCQSLTTVIFPSSLEYCGSFAFENTAWLKSQSDDYVIVGDGVLIKYLGNDYTVNVPEGVKSISSAFYDSYDILEINLPSTLENLSANAFYSCTLLKRISINNNTNFVVEDNILYSADGFEIIFRPAQASGNSVTIKDGVTKISAYAFANNSRLKNVIFPDSLKQISEYAFEYCSSLESILIPDSVSLIDKYAFSLCVNLNEVKLGNSIEKISEGTFNGCRSIEEITIPEQIRIIEDKAFFYCTALKKAQIPSTTSVADTAFEGCNELSP